MKPTTKLLNILGQNANAVYRLGESCSIVEDVATRGVLARLESSNIVFFAGALPRTPLGELTTFPQTL